MSNPSSGQSAWNLESRENSCARAHDASLHSGSALGRQNPVRRVSNGTLGFLSAPCDKKRQRKTLKEPAFGQMNLQYADSSTPCPESGMRQQAAITARRPRGGNLFPDLARTGFRFLSLVKATRSNTGHPAARKVRAIARTSSRHSSPDSALSLFPTPVHGGGGLR